MRLSPTIAAAALAAAGATAWAAPPAALRVEVLSARPHDTGAFTQGLLVHGNSLFESTGRYGASTLREVEPTTGAVLRAIALDDSYFGEGLALVPGDGVTPSRLVQLTWKESVALVWDLETFALVDTWTYSGEGWGLCFDGAALVMSDGSATLTRRDPATFAALGEVEVTVDGVPRSRLNELECVGDEVFANVWLTDEILRIDAATGEVTGVVDAAGLLTDADAAEADVLNGIAAIPDDGPAGGRFFVTGKLWPKLFEVRFVEENGEPDPGPNGCGAAASLAAAAGPLLVLATRRRRAR